MIIVMVTLFMLIVGCYLVGPYANKMYFLNQSNGIPMLFKLWL